jgi:hypothetical protein
MRKFLMRTVVYAGAILLGTIATIPAHAMTFNFSVTGSGDIASGTFTANLSSPGTYALTGITGAFDGSAITGLSSYADADNKLFFPTQPYVDFQGISFHTASLGDINLFFNSGYFEVKSSVDSIGYYFSGTPIRLAVSATPLPSGLPLFAGGLAALGLLCWRKRERFRTASA